MSKELISVIMPVKNGAEFLDECLLSIQTQKDVDWELIAVNDHSSDQSMDIIEKWALKDDRIHLIQNKGEGIPALWNPDRRRPRPRVADHRKSAGPSVDTDGTRRRPGDAIARDRRHGPATARRSDRVINGWGRIRPKGMPHLKGGLKS